MQLLWGTLFWSAVHALLEGPPLYNKSDLISLFLQVGIKGKKQDIYARLHGQHRRAPYLTPSQLELQLAQAVLHPRQLFSCTCACEVRR